MGGDLGRHSYSPAMPMQDRVNLVLVVWAQLGKNRQISHQKSCRVPKLIAFSVATGEVLLGIIHQAGAV